MDKKITTRKSRRNSNGDLIELDKVKTLIVRKIKEVYGMSVREFSRSKECEDLGIDGSHLPAYLSSGATSFPKISALCEALEIGTLSKKTITTRTINYRLCQKEK